MSILPATFVSAPPVTHVRHDGFKQLIWSASPGSERTDISTSSSCFQPPVEGSADAAAAAGIQAISPLYLQTDITLLHRNSMYGTTAMTPNMGIYPNPDMVHPAIKPSSSFTPSSSSSFSCLHSSPPSTAFSATMAVAVTSPAVEAVVGSTVTEETLFPGISAMPDRSIGSVNLNSSFHLVNKCTEDSVGYKAGISVEYGVLQSSDSSNWGHPFLGILKTSSNDSYNSQSVFTDVSRSSLNCSSGIDVGISIRSTTGGTRSQSPATFSDEFDYDFEIQSVISESDKVSSGIASNKSRIRHYYHYYFCYHHFHYYFRIILFSLVMSLFTGHIF